MKTIAILVVILCHVSSFLVQAYPVINPADLAALKSMAKYLDRDSPAGFTLECGWLLTCDGDGHVTQLWLPRLKGRISPAIGNLKKLKYLNFASGQLYGSVPSTIGNLTWLLQLDISNNKLTGYIPKSIIKLRSLDILDISQNQFVGKILFTLIQMPNLGVANVADNRFTGLIPSTLGQSLPRLRGLKAGKNEFTGKIPWSISKMTQLDTFDFHENQLNGSIPRVITELPKMFFLRLDSNRLTGIIPWEIGYIPRLYYLLLNNNSLSGKIPPSLGIGPIAQTFAIIYLSNNQLSGKVPDNLSNTIFLDLRLENNYFTNKVPIYTNRKNKCFEFEGNCFTNSSLPATCVGTQYPKQRPQTECVAFCDATQERGACGGRGRCFRASPEADPTCKCDNGYSNSNNVYTCTRSITPPPAM